MRIPAVLMCRCGHFGRSHHPETGLCCVDGCGCAGFGRDSMNRPGDYALTARHKVRAHKQAPPTRDS